MFHFVEKQDVNFYLTCQCTCELELKLAACAGGHCEFEQFSLSFYLFSETAIKMDTPIDLTHVTVCVYGVDLLERLQRWIGFLMTSDKQTFSGSSSDKATVDSASDSDGDIGIDSHSLTSSVA